MLKDYIIYFELMGQVVSFEVVHAPRVTTSIYSGGYSVPRALGRFAECWRESYIQRIKDDIQASVKELHCLFLVKKLFVYMDRHTGDNKAADDLIIKLVDSIESTCNYAEEMVSQKDQPLELCYVRRNLVHFAKGWNDELRSLAHLVASELNLVTGKTDCESLLSNNLEVSSNGFKEQVSSELGSVKVEECSFAQGKVENSLDIQIEHVISQSIKDRYRMLQSVNLSELFVFRGHPNIPATFSNSFVFVYDDEPTSWIAHALRSKDHIQRIFEITETVRLLKEFQNCDWSAVLSKEPESSMVSTMLEFRDLHPLASIAFQFTVQVFFPLHFYAIRQAFLKRQTSKGKQLDPETSFIESLSRCSSWRATGGKSRSTFFKSKDGRFIAKSISAEELNMFLTIAQRYFSYLGGVYKSNAPSAIQRVLGVYTTSCRDFPFVNLPPAHSTLLQAENDLVEFSSPADNFSCLSDLSTIDPTVATQQKYTSAENIIDTSFFVGGVEKNSSSEIPVGTPIVNADGAKVQKVHFIILENLFPTDDNSVARFDLKGNTRNRLVNNPKIGDVLMDRNFFEFTGGIPLPLHHDAKKLLSRAIDYDSKFFEDGGIVDYSVLIGIPSTGKQLDSDAGTSNGWNEETTPIIRLGMIDFFQQYNVKKMIESKVKQAGMIAGHLQPTVIDPAKYRSRMLRSVEKYFTVVPDNKI